MLWAWSEGKRFCPKCKAWTMEGLILKQHDRMEPVPQVLGDRLTFYQCPVCLHVGYEPVL
jgi:hypothetical protein